LPIGCKSFRDGLWRHVTEPCFVVSLLATKGPMIVDCKKLQVNEPVVPTFPIDVIDLMVIWDWSMLLDPDASMK
jgi:hypothetical protein